MEVKVGDMLERVSKDTCYWRKGKVYEVVSIFDNIISISTDREGIHVTTSDLCGWVKVSTNATDEELVESIDKTIEQHKESLDKLAEFDGSNTKITMDKERFKSFRDEICKSINELINKKNADYTAGGSVFSNFELTEDIGIPRLTGLTIRILDKIQRLKSFTKKNKLAVENEGVEDIFKDLIGYSLIALGMLEEDK